MIPLPSENEWVLKLFQQMLENTETEGRRDFVFRHPVLLSSYAIRVLSDPGGHSEALAMLEEMRLYYWDHAGEFPAGLGPLSGLIEGLRTRQLTYDQAKALAVVSDCAGLLSNTYIKVELDPLITEAGTGEAFPAQAAEVVLDSAWAMPFENLASQVKLTAARGFTMIVHAMLVQNPDGRLLTRAQEVGDWALNALESRGMKGAKGEMLHELGVMNLDPYTSQFPTGKNYMEKVNSWLARAVHPMPDPAEALARASQLLTDAVGLRRPGSDRGATLKALMQSRLFEAAAGGLSPDPDELRTIAHAALKNLDPNSDAGDVEWVHKAMEVLKLE